MNVDVAGVKTGVTFLALLNSSISILRQKLETSQFHVVCFPW